MRNGKGKSGPITLRASKPKARSGTASDGYREVTEVGSQLQQDHDCVCQVLGGGLGHTKTQ